MSVRAIESLIGTRSGASAPTGPRERRHLTALRDEPALTSGRTGDARRLSAALLGADLLSMTLAVLLTAHGGIAEFGAVAVLLVLNVAGGLYRAKLTTSALDEVPALFVRGLAATALTAALIVGQSGRQSFAELPQGFVIAAVVFTVLVAATRGCAYAWVRRLRSRGRLGEPTLVLGAGRVGDQVARMLLDRPEYGMRPIGFLDSAPAPHGSQAELPVLGTPQQLTTMVRRYGVRRVIIAFGAFREWEMIDTIRQCEDLGCEISFVPRFFEFGAAAQPAGDHLSSYPFVGMLRRSRRSLGGTLKRALDVTVAGAALVLLSPVMLVSAIALHLETGAGVLFRQVRIGRDGRPFTLLKFQTLKPANEEESATRWNVAHDDRLGRVGRFLRGTSLDELPQLWNILVGDMTLVGPRPERPHFVDEFSGSVPGYKDRHRVTTGLTGWAQVNGLRGDTSIEDRARFDNYYIENWSLWQDIGIMLRTVSAVLRSKGA